MAIEILKDDKKCRSAPAVVYPTVEGRPELTFGKVGTD
jgi:hypothetical protein